MISSIAIPKTTDISILATDVKDELLRIARNGVYSESYLGEMQDQEISRFFSQTKNGDYEVKSHIKSMVTFNRHDLMKDDYPHNMDMIICRNVLIYVDRQAQNDILNKFLKSLKPNGLLVLGRTETLFGDFRKSVDIISTKHRIYQKKDIGFQEISLNNPAKSIINKIQSRNSEIGSKKIITKSKKSTESRLEELRDFRKTFEERKRAWEERLERSKREREMQRKRVERERETIRRKKQMQDIELSRIRNKKPTEKEIDVAKQKGSLSDYRALLKQSTEPPRVSRIRRDLDKE
jgi:hypothetical protein